MRAKVGVTRDRFLPSLDAMLAELTHCVATGELTGAEIAQAMSALLDGAEGEDTKAEFLSTWANRGETASELAACAKTLLPRAKPCPIQHTWNDQPLLDCCGTGGGGLNLLNISTGIVFILAAMGIPVVKHGNRGLTKKSGSADVLEALGIKIDSPSEKLKACLEEVGAAFLFAPAYHTSFSALSSVRKKLGAKNQRTVFNLLGPLLNPAQPDARLVGVFKKDHIILYWDALREIKCTNYTVACGEDRRINTPIGEVSGEGTTYYRSTRRPRGSESFSNMILGDGSTEVLESLLVENAQESAFKLYDIFGKPGELQSAAKRFARTTLIANAAVAAWTQGRAASFEEGNDLATEALDSKRTFAVLTKWQEFSKKA